MTVRLLINVMIACFFFFFLAQADLCGEPLCLLHIRSRGDRSKMIPAFTFSTHHGGKVLLIFPCTCKY